MVAVRGCHLVGSLPLPDSSTSFTTCARGIPDRLRRLPDGETGTRSWFTHWQNALFATVAPEVLSPFALNASPSESPYTPDEVQAGIAKLHAARPLATGYDDVAVASYARFRDLRDQGVIPAGVKFQVSLPTVVNVLAPFVQRAFQAAAEPVYEEALFRAIRSIHDRIPHGDLAIQIDLAVDTMFWEGCSMYQPWFGGDVKEYITRYILRMIDQVDEDVELGLHNCYGDMDHRHWMEPQSLAAIAERGQRVLDGARRPVNFFHVPVPKSARDRLDDYFAPLAGLVPTLRRHGTELIVGGLHENDRATTERIIAAAQRNLHGLDEFAISTECGLGRVAAEELDGLMQDMVQLTEALPMAAAAA